jgi:pimeloyl-ACP methyl ester carboxylesterase
MSAIRERTVTTADGVALHVREAGDPAAPPLVLLHGFAGSSRLWDAQLADPELTGRFRVVTPDLRGHGLSQTDLAPEQLVAQDMDGHARIWSAGRSWRRTCTRTAAWATRPCSSC